jgi:hypothetical protein
MQEFTSFSGNKISEHYINKILNELPASLDAFYDRILNRVPRIMRDELHNVLKWLLLGTRPFYIEEAIDACIVRPDELVRFDKDRRLDPLDIVGKLIGLVKLEPPYANDAQSMSRGRHILTLAHFSVREYLLPAKSPLRPPSPWRVNGQLAHREIVRSCLAYVHHCCNQPDGRSADFSLRKYAWLNWAIHLAAASKGSVTDSQTRLSALRIFNTIAFPVIYAKSDRDHQEQSGPAWVSFKEATDFLSSDEYDKLLCVLGSSEFPYDLDDSPALSPAERGSIHSGWYSYSPLFEYPMGIRLVILHPSRDRDSPLKCSLLIDSLDNSPDYEALSYTWGSGYDREVIQIDGRWMEIRSNLSAALRELRERDACRVLWVDALCISMSDLAERSSQVRLMSQIYSNACRVLLWLGEETPLSHVGMQSLSGASRTILHDEEIAGLDDILSRPIWLRSWLIQEIVVAKRVVVRCGPICMDWDDIRGLDWLKLYILSRPRDLPYESDYEFHDLLKKCSAVAALQDLRSRHANQGRSTLLELLHLSRYHMSTDPRDRIYSILSLLPQAELSNTLLQPDYSLSMADVYTRAAFYILETLQNLDLFSYITRPYDNPFTDDTWDAALPVKMLPLRTARTDEYDSLKDLPSWVPTWGGNDATMQSMLFNACGHFSTYPIRISVDFRTITVQGVMVDRIGFANSRSQGIIIQYKLHQNEYSWDNAFRDTCAGAALQTRYPDERRRREAGWRTVLSDCKIMSNSTFARLASDDITHLASDEWLWREYHLQLYDIRRSFFITKKGYPGWGPFGLRPGDIIVVLLSGKVPYILREEDGGGSYRLIGQR